MLTYNGRRIRPILRVNGEDVPNKSVLDGLVLVIIAPIFIFAVLGFAAIVLNAIFGG